MSKTVTPNASINKPAIRSAIISSVVARWPVRTITAPAIASKAPKTFSPGAMITGSLPRADGNSANIATSLYLPVDDGEHQLQVPLRCAFPCGAATPRLRERITARGSHEPLGPSCASSAPADWKIASQSTKATRTPSRTASGSWPASARRRPGRIRCAGPLGFPSQPASLACGFRVRDLGPG
jgi:hypothetical protein